MSDYTRLVLTCTNVCLIVFSLSLAIWLHRLVKHLETLLKEKEKPPDDDPADWWKQV